MNLMIQLCKCSKKFRDIMRKQNKTNNQNKKIKPTTQTSEEYCKEIGTI